MEKAAIKLKDINSEIKTLETAKGLNENVVNNFKEATKAAEEYRMSVDRANKQM